MRATLRVLGFAVVFVPAALRATTYTVTAQGESGAGTIGQAITDANAHPGLDTIVFNIPGTPPFSVMLFFGIPAINDPVVIDGTTQPGYSGTPLFLIRSGLGQGPGLTISSGGSGSTIRGLAFADINEGIRIESDNNTIEACFFGTDVTGMLDLGNTGKGISILNGDLNDIGGTSAAARNLISGNNGYGVQISGGSGNRIRGNLIGTKINGTEALGNQVGVSITNGGSDNQVGGGAAGAGNVISGNLWGIELVDGIGNEVSGNSIGTDAGGTLDLGNGIGVKATNETGLLVGGTTANARNVIAANGTGVHIGSGDDNAIRGNFIGTDAAGALPLGNDYGVVVNAAAATDTKIGGEDAFDGNIIAFNGTGIWNLGLRTTIRRNSIHDNAALGIDHGNVGPDPNTQGDLDPVQNFPIIQSVEITELPAGGSVHVTGFLWTNAGDFTLDFYANPPCADDPREYLEGETWLGSAPLTVGGGDGSFDVTLPVALPLGSRISATATDAIGRTSEFSQRMPFTITPSAGASGTAVQVFGTNFEPGLAATIGGVTMTINGAVFSSFFNATTPVLPGGVYDVTVTNTTGLTGTLVKGWIADFADVPPADPFYAYIQKLVRHGITAGVGGGAYGSTSPTLRQQMAVFLMKAIHGICYVPPSCSGVFTDVPCPSSFADWIEAFAAEGITGGCGGGLYCPNNPVRRDQMAVFLLKAKYGSIYLPPDCTGVFEDVPCPSTFAAWIEQLAAEGVTGGCGTDVYCPQTATTRGQMAVFIVKTFDLQ
jgi:hypothetical protein